MFLKPPKETSNVFVYPAEANDLGSVFLNFSGYLSSNERSDHRKDLC